MHSSSFSSSEWSAAGSFNGTFGAGKVLEGGGLLLQAPCILHNPASTAIIKNHFTTSGTLGRCAKKSKKKSKWHNLQANLALFRLCFGTLLHAVIWLVPYVARPCRFKRPCIMCIHTQQPEVLLPRREMSQSLLLVPQERPAAFC